MDYINPCNKNQTAKVLERFFYVSNGREYISVIPEEAERITKLDISWLTKLLTRL